MVGNLIGDAKNYEFNLQLNYNRETNPGTNLGATSGSGHLQGCKRTLEDCHSRPIQPILSRQDAWAARAQLLPDSLVQKE